MGTNIGFIGTRFAGNDGVTLESAKWAQLLWDANEHVSYWFAGKLDTHPDVSMLVPSAWFGYPDVAWINERIFGRRKRSADVTRLIYNLSDHLKREIYAFTRKFDIEILVAQNSLCIPMNVPLGVALTNFIAETGFPTIAHHHDFYWERDRFAVNAIGDMLDMAFPPTLPSIQHVTINSFAQEDLSHRKGVSSELVPNVLNFESPPEPPDEYAQNFRDDIGVGPDDILFLQPTRVVPRKGIEHAISLVAALEQKNIKLVISHESGDEGDEYRQLLTDLAAHNNVDLIFCDSRVGEKRGKDAEGRRIFTLADAYSQADFITYPSLYEGFGNALIEAFYYRKPILVNRYSIFIADIEPHDFRVISMNGLITKEVVAHVDRVIEDREYRQEMVDTNYELGKKFFSYTVLRRKLRALVTNFTGAEDL
ncbi:MAG: glycosyltransferase family 4 protein [bacterium]|nr:glycosyltransferase family 4 protein [bacterium]